MQENLKRSRFPEPEDTVIMNFSGSDVKLFSTTDCTGNYATVKDDVYNAQWVNSISYGKSGIPSEGPNGCANLWK
ncbi:hypothetical protein EC991_011071 [Linnemannia zychae]|nr:hypothetical protein EC991_011071 [Linnemannia zychae]